MRPRRGAAHRHRAEDRSPVPLQQGATSIALRGRQATEKAERDPVPRIPPLRVDALWSGRTRWGEASRDQELLRSTPVSDDACDRPPAHAYREVGLLQHVHFAPELIPVVVTNAHGTKARATIVGWMVSGTPLYLSPKGRVCRLLGWSVDSVGT